MPGEVGNFAIAAHRSAYGGGMHEIERAAARRRDLRRRPQDGWYTYRFRDLEYVTPDRPSTCSRRCRTIPTLHADRPHHHPHELQPAATPRPSASSPTACSSRWQPRTAGPPAEIADVVAAWGA